MLGTHDLYATWTRLSAPTISPTMFHCFSVLIHGTYSLVGGYTHSRRANLPSTFGHQQNGVSGSRVFSGRPFIDFFFFFFLRTSGHGVIRLVRALGVYTAREDESTSDYIGNRLGLGSRGQVVPLANISRTPWDTPVHGRIDNGGHHRGIT